MAGVLLLVILGALLCVVVLVVVVVVALSSSRSGSEGRPTAAVLDRRRRWFRVTGLGVGLVAGCLVATSGQLGRGLLLAAPVAALGLLLGVLAAELSVRAPSGPRRSASLTVRRAADYLPRPLTAVVVATGSALAVTLLVTTLSGSRDDMGRAGRVLTAEFCVDTVQSRGPWPGVFYTAPLVSLLLVGVVLALVVLRLVVARAPLLPESDRQGTGGPSETPGTALLEVADDLLRMQAARAVVSSVGVLLSVPLVGIALFAGSAVLGIRCAPAWWTVGGVALLVLSALSLAVLCWSGTVALAPGRASSPTRASR